MKRIFSIEWSDEYGEMWMNRENLETCLFSSEHIGEKIKNQIRVKDVTETTTVCEECMKAQKRNNKEGNAMLTERQLQILGVYDLFDDDDISTERLFAMTCDSAECEMEELTDALYAREQERENENPILHHRTGSEPHR